MKLDNKTKHAIIHTLHCLLGCAIGEIMGMLIASLFGWHKAERIPLAIILAFTCGYTLTYRSARKNVDTPREALKIALATDTVSITSMEIVDNIIEIIIPNALVVTATSFRFWWGLAAALSVAFVITVPVNRLMMDKMAHNAHH
jgi:hypothetical protein